MNDRDFYCSRCSLQFNNKSIFDMHLSIVHKENVEIKEEPKSFENNPNFASGTEVYTSEPCNSSFDTKTILVQHNSLYQGENKPFNFEICDYRSSLIGNLKKHVESVHEEKKAFKCEICDYSSSYKHHLKSHVASVHEKKKPFKCEVCDFSCSFKYSKKHL